MLREQVAAAQLGLDQQMGKMRSDMETEILQLRTALDNERDMSKRAVRDALNSGSFQVGVKRVVNRPCKGCGGI